MKELGLSVDMTKSTDDPKSSVMLANRSQARKAKSPEHTRSLQYSKLKQSKPKPAKPTKSKRRDKHIAANAKEAKKDDGIRIVEELREKLHKELLSVLEEEQRKEVEREEKLKGALPEEQKRLEGVFGIERAKASNRIVKMSE